MMLKSAIERSKLHGAVRLFVADERGATAIEYALVAAGISIAIVAVVPEIGSAVATMFSEVKDGL